MMIWYNNAHRKGAMIGVSKKCMRAALAIAAMAFSSFLRAPAAFAVSLIPCPDCGREVSPRALMCPGCGCNGETIAGEAARLAKAEEPPQPDDSIRADFGDHVEMAVPVMFGDKPYAVLPLASLVGLKTLTLSFVSTNAPIMYSSIDVADAAPLVRLGLEETNLVFKAGTDVAPGETWTKISPMRLKNNAAKLLEERSRK